jgi:hypothetical protein
LNFVIGVPAGIDGIVQGLWEGLRCKKRGSMSAMDMPVVFVIRYKQIAIRFYVAKNREIFALTTAIVAS